MNNRNSPVVMKLLSGRVRDLALLVDEISFQEVGERLLRHLFREARARGEFKNGEIYLDLNLTQSQIAARIGTVRKLFREH